MEKVKPLISLVIPVYNVAPYLCECLDSVSSQTYTDWEAICVEDGSTDESGAILDEYAKRDSGFRVVHQSNAGASAARNVGLAAARGILEVCDVQSQRMLSPFVVLFRLVRRLLIGK